MTDDQFDRQIEQAVRLVPHFAESFPVYFGVSKPTVRRWVAKTNRPHEYMREHVVYAIDAYLEDCLETE